MRAREIFITGTNKGIVPVVNVDDRIIGDGMPGQNTLKIKQLFEDHAKELNRTCS